MVDPDLDLGSKETVPRFPQKPTFLWVSLYFQLFLQLLWEQLRIEAVQVLGRAGPGTLLSIKRAHGAW